MTIADEILRLNNAKAAIKTSLENKGVEVSDSALLDEYPALIDKIEVGEGGGPNPYQQLYMLRTSDGTNMKGLFYYCTAPELDLSNLDVSKATDMSYMFCNCFSAINIDGWDTSKLTNASYMFQNFSGSIDISKLNFSNVTNVTYMFHQADTDKIILTGLSFPKTTSLNNMFASTKGTTLDLSSWDINNITNMSNLFYSSQITRIDLTGWKTTNVTNMSGMFNAFSSYLVELIIPDWDMTNVTSSSSFLPSSATYTAKLMLIDLSRSNDTTVTKIASYLPTRTLTTYGDVLIPVDSSQAAIDALIAKYWRPVGPKLDLISCEVVPELDEIFPNKSTKLYSCNYEPWYGDETVIEYVSSDNSVATIDGDIITSTGVVGTTEITARNKETLEVLSEPLVFAVSETDSYPNVIKFRGTSTPNSNNHIYVNGTSSSNKVLLSAMDYNSLTGIYTYDVGAPITSIKFNGSGNTSSTYTNTCTDIVKINTSNITDMSGMFDSCSNLTSIDLSNFDTSKVTNMYYMFEYCSNLTSIDVSNFDTSKVTNMSGMFKNCFNLTSLDLSNFDTSKVTDIAGMFSDCSALEILDIRNFNLDNNIYVNIFTLFSSCRSLHTLRLDNCSNFTINRMIGEVASHFPTNAIEGVTRKIYCKQENAEGLTAPTNWVFIDCETNEPIE